MLEDIVRVAAKINEGMNNFYDKRSSPWYKEAAKHLVPSYNANRASNLDLGTLITFGAALLDMSLFFVYIKGSVNLLKDLF